MQRISRSLLSAAALFAAASCSPLPSHDVTFTTGVRGCCLQTSLAAPGGVVYVGVLQYSPNRTAIQVYHRPSLKLALTITKGLGGTFPGSHSLTVDGLGNLYAATFSPDAINIFKPGRSSPSSTLKTGLDSPYAITVDRTGNLYVANCYNCNYYNHRKPDRGSVTLFEHGATKPKLIITKGIYNPDSLATDATGNLYVSNCGPQAPNTCFSNYYDAPAGGSVTVYRPGSNTPSYTITNGIDAPQTVAVDPRGNLYVANLGDSQIAVYPSKATTPTYDILLGIFDGVYPTSMTFDPENNLYVAMCSFGATGRICIFAPGSASTLAFLQSPLNYNPRIVALDSAENLYVLEAGISTVESGPPNANETAVAFYPRYAATAARVVSNGPNYVSAMALGP